MDYVEIKGVRLLKQTEKAGHFMLPGKRLCWIPWSQIENNNEDMKDGYEGRIYVTEWFVKKEGIK